MSLTTAEQATPEKGKLRLPSLEIRNFRAFEAFIVATALYFVLSVVVRHLLQRFGARWLFGSR